MENPMTICTSNLVDYESLGKQDSISMRANDSIIHLLNEARRKGLMAGMGMRPSGKPSQKQDLNAKISSFLGKVLLLFPDGDTLNIEFRFENGRRQKADFLFPKTVGETRLVLLSRSTGNRSRFPPAAKENGFPESAKALNPPPGT
jgi:hypothetical protein